MVWDAPYPSIWRNELSSESDRFYDTVMITDNNACWKYEDVYGNTHLHGMVYGPVLKWDDSLVLSRWEDSTNPDDCMSM